MVRIEEPTHCKHGTPIKEICHKCLTEDMKWAKKRLKELLDLEEEQKNRPPNDNLRFGEAHNEQ